MADAVTEVTKIENLRPAKRGEGARRADEGPLTRRFASPSPRSRGARDLSANSRGQQFPECFGRAFEGFVELVRIFSARLREVRLPPALAADNRRKLLDQGVSGHAVDQVFGYGRQQRDFAVGGAAQDDDAALDLGAELVGEIAKISAADVVSTSSQELDAVDVDRFVGRRRG